MREFGGAVDDPILYFCEDWMLADEVTHVKMGSDWLRRITADDPERRKAALDFQRTVDKLFSFGGFRGEEEENPIHLARKFRSLAGFNEDEISDLVDAAAEAYAEAQAQWAVGPAGLTPILVPARSVAVPTLDADPTLTSPVLLDIHRSFAWFVIVGNGLAGVWALGANWWEWLRTRALWWFTVTVEVAIFVQVAMGVGMVAGQKLKAPQFHMFYGFVAIISVGPDLQLPGPDGEVPLPALRLRRPVPHGAGHPGRAGRPPDLQRFTTGQVTVRVRPSIIWTWLTTIWPSSSMVAASARTITS